MRSLQTALLTLVVLVFCHGQVMAMFMWYEMENVPIDRLMTNVQQRLLKNTNDFESTYCLARLYSMAYAVGSTEVQVRSNTLSPEFAPPGRDTGVPEKVRSFFSGQERQRALMNLTNAITLY